LIARKATGVKISHHSKSPTMINTKDLLTGTALLNFLESKENRNCHKLKETYSTKGSLGRKNINKSGHLHSGSMASTMELKNYTLKESSTS
jgi:hypothetical protein